MVREWQAPHVAVVSEAVNSNFAFEECDAVLSYSGAGFISASLLAGKPMVFYVRNLGPTSARTKSQKLGPGIFPNPQVPQA